MVTKSFLRSLDGPTYVRAVLDGGFKKCCMRSGSYDGSRRNYFFPRIEAANPARGDVAPCGRTIGMRYVLEIRSSRHRRRFRAGARSVPCCVNLRDAGKLYAHEEEHHDSVRWWFHENLEKPTRFTTSKPPFYRKKSRAISWFKDSATEHLVAHHEPE
jgi:hypothetical protein